MHAVLLIFRFSFHHLFLRLCFVFGVFVSFPAKTEKLILPYIAAKLLRKETLFCYTFHSPTATNV